MNNYKDTIPVFFAVDYKYAPMLGVALKSMLDNASKEYFYKIYVLTTTLDDKLRAQVSESLSENSDIEFISLKERLDSYSNMFHLRDYYSQETYFRLFIASLFPEYNKVIYLDSDLLVVGDISEMYTADLGNNLLGGAVEEVMTEYDVFGTYVEKALGIKREKYINAGIIVINTKLFREEQIQEKFVKLLNSFVFRVTQDEDYLNVLCKDRIHYFDLGWNKTSFENKKFDDKNLRIIHYKMMWRPWKYDGVLYGDYFWKYAKETPFYDTLRSMLANYSDEEKAKDNVILEKLSKMAVEDSYDFHNYWNTIQRERIGHGLREIIITSAKATVSIASSFANNAVNGLKKILKHA